MPKLHQTETKKEHNSTVLHRIQHPNNNFFSGVYPTCLYVVVPLIISTTPANDIPVLDSVEGILVGNVIHENEAHGSSVVSCGNGAVTFLASRVLRKEKSNLITVIVFIMLLQSGSNKESLEIKIDWF